MTSINLNMTPYEYFIDISYSYEYYNNIANIKCICKDILLKTLDEIKNIEGLIDYDVYICGKINSASSFPTWDCDLTLVNSEKDDEKLIEIFKNIKIIGFNNNLLFDLKFMRNISDWNIGVQTPDNFFEALQANFFWNKATDECTLQERVRSMRIRKRRNRFYTYYNALLIKKKGSINLEVDGINFISNTILPDSSLRDSEMYDDRYSFRNFPIPWTIVVNDDNIDGGGGGGGGGGDDGINSIK